MTICYVNYILLSSCQICEEAEFFDLDQRDPTTDGWDHGLFDQMT